MQGKYRNIAVHCAAWLFREFTRARLTRLVRWSPLTDPEIGCTAVIGMCSRLPNALDANLRCLYAARWPELRSVVIAIDATRAKIGIKDGRSLDYDTTLYVQDRWLTPEQRTCVPMSLEGLVHPSQMIHQYTMFRKYPGRPLPSFSMPMLPFFSCLAGNAHALGRAAASLRVAALDGIGHATESGAVRVRNRPLRTRACLGRVTVEGRLYRHSAQMDRAGSHQRLGRVLARLLTLDPQPRCKIGRAHD